jgi:hypothetical protein
MILLLILMLQPIHVEGSGNVWTQGGYTWAGQSSCYEAGFLIQKDSDALDQGAFIDGLHCNHPGFDTSGCVEWFGSAPDIGACEMLFSSGVPAPPASLAIGG